MNGTSLSGAICQRGSMAKLLATGEEDPRPKEVRRATAELVAT